MGTSPYNLIQRGIYNINDDFVFSVYVKKDPETKFKSNGIDFYSSVTDKNGVKIDTSHINDVWSRIFITFPAEEVPVSSRGSSIRFEPNINIKDGYLYFACPKLEKGTVPTDYAPAPEDFDLTSTQN